jgi:hypothetical protein
VWIRHPEIPFAAWVAISGLFGLVVLAAVVHHIKMKMAGRKNLLPRALLLTSVTIAHGVAVFVIDDIIVSIAVVTAYHNLQYLGLMWFHNKNRAADEPDDKNTTIHWLQSGRTWLYLGVTFFYGIMIISPRAAFQGVRAAELPLAFVVAMHYYVDARIWRFNNYPERGKWLRLFKPKPKPAEPEPAAAEA